MEDTIVDYITGRVIPDIGPEGSRQRFEKFLVETKGYAKSDVQVDAPITVLFKGAPYHSTLDLVVFCDTRPFMAVRCIAGSLGSYEREILAGARLIYDHQVPLSVSTNGRDALIRETATGKKFGTGMDAIPTKQEAAELLKKMPQLSFPENKKEREMILFRSYNMQKFEKECDG